MFIVEEGCGLGFVEFNMPTKGGKSEVAKSAENAQLFLKFRSKSDSEQLQSGLTKLSEQATMGDELPYGKC